MNQLLHGMQTSNGRNYTFLAGFQMAGATIRWSATIREASNHWNIKGIEYLGAISVRGDARAIIRAAINRHIELVAG